MSLILSDFEYIKYKVRKNPIELETISIKDIMAKRYQVMKILYSKIEGLFHMYFQSKILSLF